jgi:CheY-like chemotaxis protein
MHHGPCCVIVDDDEDVLILVGQYLGVICPEFEVFRFLNGLDALEFLTKNRVELVITDYRMPSLDGLQLTRAIRATDHEVPIIMLSGDEVELDALAAGASAFVPKAAVASRLATAIRQLGNPLRT